MIVTRLSTDHGRTVHHCRMLQKPGQTLVELALILPMLLTFFFAIVELGIVFSVYVGLTNSAREGARAGSIYQFDTDRDGNPDTASLGNQSFAAARQTVDDDREARIEEAIAATRNPLVDPSKLAPPTFGYEPEAGTDIYRYGDKVIVTLSYPHQLFFDLLRGPTLTLRASSEMRIEPGGR